VPLDEQLLFDFRPDLHADPDGARVEHTPGQPKAPREPHERLRPALASDPRPARDRHPGERRGNAAGELLTGPIGDRDHQVSDGEGAWRGCAVLGSGRALQSPSPAYELHMDTPLIVTGSDDRSHEAIGIAILPGDQERCRSYRGCIILAKRKPRDPVALEREG